MTPSAYCCTITPFDEAGRLDEDAWRLLVDRLGVGGLGAFVGTSSPGEGFALSLAETERLYGVAKEAMAGRQPVRAMGVEPREVGRVRGVGGIMRFSLRIFDETEPVHRLGQPGQQRRVDGDRQRSRRTERGRRRSAAVGGCADHRCRQRTGGACRGDERRR